mmetsp:Transcript_134553/g.429788  ORF Transcript_134553/g.429788 Transcript_134553/m.429788 type:complete len:207 (-) Transcript_134553:691-1311(-)
MGTTAKGRPNARASCMLFAPPWVTKAEHRGSNSICGTASRKMKFSGTSGRPSKASGMLPNDITTKKRSSPPSASKHTLQTCWQNSLPFKSAKPLERAKSPKVLFQRMPAVATVPKETKTNLRPTASCSSMYAQGRVPDLKSVGTCAASVASAALWPMLALRKRCTEASMSGPTQRKGALPKRCSCLAETGGAKSSLAVVTRVIKGE